MLLMCILVNAGNQLVGRTSAVYIDIDIYTYRYI
jgi:hypothetical protein